MTTHGKGTFDVKIDPQDPIESADGVTVGRMTARKQFQGDLEGTSTAHMLTAGGEVKDSGAYVAIERIIGTLHGRRGSFVVQHSGTMTRGAPHLTITVVPDSGTGQLTGIAGEITITIVEGKHFYEIDYTLPSAP